MVDYEYHDKVDWYLISAIKVDGDAGSTECIKLTKEIKLKNKKTHGKKHQTK